MKNKIFLFSQIIAIAIVISSCDRCTKDENKKNILKVDENKIEQIKKSINLQIFRYEKDLFSINKINSTQELQNLKSKYPFFLDGDLTDLRNRKQLLDYISDPLTKEIYQKTISVFPDSSYIQNELEIGFTNYLYFFSEQKLPTVYTYVSSLDYQLPIKYVDSVLIIALDMYLGSDCKFYKQLGAPVYISSRYSKEYIAADCMKEIAYSNMKIDKVKNSLLNKMIIEGKRLFFVETMLPHIHDSIIIGYPSKKIDWSRKNETNIWSYLIKNNLLYSSDKQVIMKLTDEAPFTSYFTKDSPGRIGIWIGWQIVRSYMENNKDIKIQEMLNETDVQKIINKSKYKPKN